MENELIENPVEKTTKSGPDIEMVIEQGNQGKMASILNQFEMMALKTPSNAGLDISLFDKEEKGKLLEMMQESERHAFEFSKEKLASNERIATKVIDANVVNQKTIRYFLWVGGVSIFILAILILFFKDEYFTMYMAFVAGLGGGFGIKTMISSASKEVAQNEEEDK